MRRVLVTGASGFLGRHCLAPLVARGFEVHALAHGAPRPDPPVPEVRWHRADLLAAEGPAQVCEAIRPSHLLHMAWYAVPGRFWTAPENFAWVRASLALAEAFRRCGGRRWVGAGTCAEYDWDGGLCSESRTPLEPATTYGVCKAALWRLMAAFSRDAGISHAWGRIFVPFGPHEHPDRLTAYVIRSLLRGERAACSPGTQVRDFLYVRDLAEAFAALLDSGVEGAVNVASGRPLSVAQFASRLARAVGRPDLLDLGGRPAVPGEAPLVVAEVARLTADVGWVPRRSLEEAVDETVAYWRSVSG